MLNFNKILKLITIFSPDLNTLNVELQHNSYTNLTIDEANLNTLNVELQPARQEQKGGQNKI